MGRRFERGHASGEQVVEGAGVTREEVEAVFEQFGEPHPPVALNAYARVWPGTFAVVSRPALS